MSIRCGCYDQGDDVVFGSGHPCSAVPDQCTCGFPFGALSCPVHAKDPTAPPYIAQATPAPVLIPSEALMFAERSIPEPVERPYEQTLSDGDGDLG